MAVSRMHNKNMQYNPYLWTNCRNSRFYGNHGQVNKDVRFQIDFRWIDKVTLISYDHYINSSFVVDSAVGQIPRSTKRISCTQYDEYWSFKMRDFRRLAVSYSLDVQIKECNSSLTWFRVVTSRAFTVSEVAAARHEYITWSPIMEGRCGRTV